MKKHKIILAIILVEIIAATTTIDNIDKKYTQPSIIHKIEEHIEDIADNFKVQEEYELEIVDEYVYAMEGFIC